MGMPVVTVATGGLPVVESTNGYGTPVTEATNGRGLAVTKVVGAPGLPVIFVADGGAVASDPNFANVVFLAGFNGADGAVAYSEEKNTRAATFVSGFIGLDVDQKKFGTASLFGNGQFDNKCVYFADSADWHFGTGHFTVECWVRLATTSPQQWFVAQWGGFNSWALAYDATNISFLVSTTGADSIAVAAGAWAPSVGVWYHLAADYDGTTYRVYVDGVMKGSSTTARNIFNATESLMIGGSNTLGYYSLNGHLDEVRITKGVARYHSSSFTPPTEAFPRS